VVMLSHELQTVDKMGENIGTLSTEGYTRLLLPTKMQVEFLGTAGFHPSETRHTSCVYIGDAAPGEAILLDAGTGVFRLIGRDVPSKLHIFLSHAHLDHTMGLTFLIDVFLNRPCSVTLYGAPKTLDAAVKMFDSALFPMAFEHCTQTLTPNSSCFIAGARVSACELTHPGGSQGYRFDWPDRSLVYITDTAGDARYLEFAEDADLLIHERNFTNDLEDIARASGHCTSADVVRVAEKARARVLALTHFNPLEENPETDVCFAKEFPDTVFARDGLKLKL
jgi:ribonuclease Z